MKKTIFTLLAFLTFCAFANATQHMVNAANASFSPKDLTINAGDTVVWMNTAGLHNVNGSQQSFPDNPESFSSGAPAGAPWTYSHTFNAAGHYDYQCDIHFGAGMTGTITVMPAAASGDVVISEIMYNDPTSGNDAYEFIELYNNGADPVNMEGWSFTKGVTFTFPSYTLGAGQFVVTAINGPSFETLFGVPALQWDGGALANGGETIELSDAMGNFVDSVRYGPSGAWPSQANGNGSSLVLCDYGADNADPANWAAATTPTGVQVNNTEIKANPGADSECPTGPTVYPVYTIAQVTQVNASGIPDSLGRLCELTGIVHGVDLNLGPQIQFFLLDPTGGISIFSGDDFGYTVQEGDEVKVRGVISQFSCLTQITPDTLWKVSSGNPTFPPATVTALNENTESEIVRIENVTIVDPNQWPGTDPSGITVEVSNGSQNFTLRIDDAVDWFMMPVPAGILTITGIGSQFDNDGTCDGGYQLMPRYQQDIAFVNGTKDAGLSEAISFYPNPASDALFIETGLVVDQVVISSLFGQQLAMVENPGKRIPVGSLQNGMYLITFKVGGAQWTARFIKI
ncbi:MAG: lamin tail domain-containing protein [Lewinellaceae bacterium]|nr:lamin tail domain-containing protein [Lewinellaceae bacterium]